MTDRGGALRGLLVNFTAHPILLGIDNFKLSAGYPGSMQRALEELHPGITALFINGAEGDQSIRVSKRNHPDDWSRMEHAGQRLARNVYRIQQASEVREDVPIAMNQPEVEMPVPETQVPRWNRTGPSPPTLQPPLLRHHNHHPRRLEGRCHPSLPQAAPRTRPEGHCRCPRQAGCGSFARQGLRPPAWWQR